MQYSTASARQSIGCTDLWPVAPHGKITPESRCSTIVGVPAVENDDNGNNRFARFVDYFTNSRDVLFVGAAGNDADIELASGIEWPWDAFNGITVGALDQVVGGAMPALIAHASASSEYWLNSDNGTAPDIRGKPDIVAPGVNIGDNHIDVNTSVMPNVNIPRNR